MPFLGCTLAEYARFFALDIDALRGSDVLDVGAGPSSFVAEARARKVDAVALDPFYGCPADDLAGRIKIDCDRMAARMRANPRLFKVGAREPGRSASTRRAGSAAPCFGSLAEAEGDRRLAAQRFLADYAAHFVHGRYVTGALPRLPFFDRTFDLVLCAHLLFVHAARFDFDWHVTACRELVRVSANEVRIHPLCGADGRPYPKLAALRRELRTGGIGGEVIAVDHEFSIGANAMLVLERTSP